MPTPPVFEEQPTPRPPRPSGAAEVLVRACSVVAAALVIATLVNPALPLVGRTPVPWLPQPGHLAPPQPEWPVAAAGHRYRDSRRALDEAIRAAGTSPRPAPPAPTATLLFGFFVNWDDASVASMRENIGRLDRLVPEWLHLVGASGAVLPDTPARQRDVIAFVRRARPGLRIVPLVNNFDPARLEWDGEGTAAMLGTVRRRSDTIERLIRYVTDRGLAGLAVDFENLPPASHEDLRRFMRELHDRMHPLGLELSQCLPLDDPAVDYKGLAPLSEYVVLMAYDQHTEVTEPGSIAAQDWFSDALERRFRDIPPARAIVALGSYGYDWAEGESGTEVSFQEAIDTAAGASARVTFDADSLNPRYGYTDGRGRTHQVWLLDAVTAFNQIREASAGRPRGYGLWRLGSEDPSVWSALEDRDRLDEDAARALQSVPYGYGVDYRGRGDLLRVAAPPRDGVRDIAYDPATGLITNERLRDYPAPYLLERYGATPGQRRVALTFDDGPDATWTPRVLDALARAKAPATFFVVGARAAAAPRVLERIAREGHEIGNHTFTHPDISAITRQQLRLEVMTTDRLFEWMLGRRSLLFRPVYAGDVDPETPAETEPLLFTASRGYLTVSAGIDSGDRRSGPADAIVSTVLAGLDAGAGNVVRLHDGGGSREATVAALPRLVDALRRRGIALVPVSQLAGLSRDAVMPLAVADRGASARIADAGYLVTGAVAAALRMLFLLGLVLSAARLLVLAPLALRQRLRAVPRRAAAPLPPIAAIVPVQGDARRIGPTLRALVESRGPAFEILVVADRALEGALRPIVAGMGEPGRIRLVPAPDHGIASALNEGLRQTTAPLVVTVEAGTVVSADAVLRLAARVRMPRVAAASGAVRLADDGGVIGRAEAVAYAVAQNLTRRAFAILSGPTVVPCAVHAWRREEAIEAGGFEPDAIDPYARLMLRVLEHGADVVDEDRAVAWIDRAATVRAGVRARVRWVLATLQTIWDGRRTLLRPRFGPLGLAGLPYLLVFELVLPMIAPFVDLSVLAAIAAAAAERQRHGAEFSSDVLERTLFYYAVFLALDASAAAVGVLLQRHPRWRLLVWTLPQRFIDRQLMYVALARAAVSAVRDRSESRARARPRVLPG